MAHEARYDFKFSLANASQIDRNAPEARYNGHRKLGPTAKSSEPFLDLKSGQKRCFSTRLQYIPSTLPLGSLQWSVLMTVAVPDNVYFEITVDRRLHFDCVLLCEH